MKRMILICLLLLATLILSSCVSEKWLTRNVPVTQTTTQTQTIIQTQTVNITITPITITTVITVSSTLTPTTQPEEKYEIIDASYKITEIGFPSWRFSWQVTIKNITLNNLRLIVIAQFIDKDGFVLSNSYLQSINLAPGEQNTIKDYCFVDDDVAPNVAGMELEIEQA